MEHITADNRPLIILTHMINIKLLQELLVIEHLILLRVNNIDVFHVDFGGVFVFIDVNPGRNIPIILLLLNQPVKLAKVLGVLLLGLLVGAVAFHEEFADELIKILVLHASDFTLVLRAWNDAAVALGL